jgi:hypothetical protein
LFGEVVDRVDQRNPGHEVFDPTDETFANKVRGKESDSNHDAECDDEAGTRNRLFRVIADRYVDGWDPAGKVIAKGGNDGANKGITEIVDETVEEFENEDGDDDWEENDEPGDEFVSDPEKRSDGFVGLIRRWVGE